MEASRNLESIPLLVPVRHRLSARDFQAEGLCEEMIEIARDTSGDNAFARLRIKALERQVARMAPRKSWAVKG